MTIKTIFGSNVNEKSLGSIDFKNNEEENERLKQHKKDIKEYIEHLSDKAKDKLEIVENSKSAPFVLRIDNRTPKFFSPLLPLSSSEDIRREDRTVPRVCVSLNLVDCILGIARLHKEFIENNVPDERNKKGNIYSISAIPFLLAVKPDKKLLFDVDLTDEHWLIGYNEDTQKFYPVNVGEMFITNISIPYKEHNNFKPLTYMKCFVNIKSDVGVMIKPNRPVEKGYYKLLIEKDDNGKLRLGEIEKTDFTQMKKVVSKENIEYKNSLIDRW